MRLVVRDSFRLEKRIPNSVSPLNPLTKNLNTKTLDRIYVFTLTVYFSLRDINLPSIDPEQRIFAKCF
jgi:hypothetical protein